MSLPSDENLPMWQGAQKQDGQSIPGTSYQANSQHHLMIGFLLTVVLSLKTTSRIARLYLLPCLVRCIHIRFRLHIRFRSILSIRIYVLSVSEARRYQRKHLPAPACSLTPDTSHDTTSSSSSPNSPF